MLAITAATATLSLGLVLHGVTDQPYLQTRAATKGPDVVAQIGGFGRGAGGPSASGQARTEAQVRALTHAPGITAYSGPYPVASAFVRFRGLSAPVELEGRAQAPAPVDQPKVTAGTWVRPGGVVLERTFAESLGVGVGDRVTLDGRAFRVAGIAVTAADLPYPNLCYSPGGGCVFDAPYSGPPPLAGVVGLAWVTEPAARALASAQAPLYYFLNLKLKNPATAPAFASRYGSAPSSPYLIPWQAIQTSSGLLVQDEQSGPLAGCPAGRAAGDRQRGRAGRRPDGRAHPAGRTAQGGRRHAGDGRGHAAGREPGAGSGRGGGRAGDRVAGRPR